MEEKKKLLYEKPEMIDFKKTGAFGGVADECENGTGAEACFVGPSAEFACDAGDGVTGV